jgi:hypothetical protein
LGVRRAGLSLGQRVEPTLGWILWAVLRPTPRLVLDQVPMPMPMPMLSLVLDQVPGR